MSTTTSFLPEDYLDQKAERRTNLISLSLFGIVMVSVFAAFLVTNRQWSQVKSARASINEQYEQAAAQIETLNELEQQKDQMLSKARLAAALVERVPRSILLAGLVNRMPNRLGLLEFELNGAALALEPYIGKPEDTSLFLIFKDRTSGKETYGAGRFLYARLEDDRAVLDFNKAYNPPCAFTPFATCPLPPPTAQDSGAL